MKREALKRILNLYKLYSLATGSFAFLLAAYVVLLNFPQILFANTVKHGEFTVYSQRPITEDLYKILDRAEAKLQASPIYDPSVERRIYLTDSFGIYAFLSHKAYGSFANSVPFIDNVFVNKSDFAADRVYIPRSWSNERSLSGVIVHETAHLFIRRRYGTITASRMPMWKNEGYCEYIAGDSTITLEEGIRRWREKPDDDTGYRFIKYHLMVKQLLENEGMNLDQFFTQPLDEQTIAARTFANLQ